MNKTALIVILVEFISLSSVLNAQLYFQDFESAEIGDQVSTLGITGVIGLANIVENVGIEGTKGFRATPISFKVTRQNGIIPVPVLIPNSGDVFTASMAVQVETELPATLLPFTTRDFGFGFTSDNLPEHNMQCDFGMNRRTNLFLARSFIFRPNTEMPFEVYFSADEVPFELIGYDPKSYFTDFITFEVQIIKQSESSYFVATNIRDKTGKILSQEAGGNRDLSQLFSAEVRLWIQFFTGGFEVLRSASFDNISVDSGSIDDVLTGDINKDGQINLLDVSPFIDLLIASHFEIEADINGDYSVDLLDVSPFVDLLTRG